MSLVPRELELMKKDVDMSISRRAGAQEDVDMSLLR